MSHYSYLLGVAAIGLGVAVGSTHALAAPAQSAKIEAKNSLVQTVGNKKRRTYYRDSDGEHVRAPFASVDTGRGTHVDAPFASVHTDRGGTYVRAPFVDLWVPR
ncbi:MAG TPA: hypothetical protein VJK06_07675 [Methyloceanibacter sp.]|nr:hypothetical protein [Methyloceanibacter sp.]